MRGELNKTLLRARRIWGNVRMTQKDIVIAMNVVAGDICRAVRDHNQAELEKEIGNMLLSTVRWADDMGLDLDHCLEVAEQCQREYVARAGLGT